MTLTIDLNPDEAARLGAEAEREGVDPTAYARQRLGLAAPYSDDEKAQALAALMNQWIAEDATMTPAQEAAAAAEWAELEANLQANRLNFSVPDLTDHD